MGKVSGKAHKCKCNSVWCPQCFKQRHIDRYMNYLQSFRWTHTREMILTVDPKKFKSGEAAYKYVTKNKLIPGLIRNIERGKKVKNPVTGKWDLLFHPLKVHKWVWFMEFHRNGYPHWHVFLEVQHQGQRGQIGVERIRHYWKNKVGEIFESYIKDIKHFRHLTSYFRGHGYFEIKGNHQKLKNHQMELPAWGKNEYGAFKNIRRSAHKAIKPGGFWVQGSERAGSLIDDRAEYYGRYFVRKGREYMKVLNKPGWYLSSKKASSYTYFSGSMENPPVKVDTRTGEIISKMPIVRDTSRTYKAMMKDCGQRTKINLYSEDTTAIGIFKIPYREVRNRIKGTYQDGIGYTFRLSKADFEWLFSFPHHIEEYDHSKTHIKLMIDQSEKKRKQIIANGYYSYRRYYG